MVLELSSKYHQYNYMTRETYFNKLFEKKNSNTVIEFKPYHSKAFPKRGQSHAALVET